MTDTAITLKREERTPLARAHKPADWVQLGEGYVPANFGDTDNIAQLQRCGLVDLSALPRFGLRGAGAGDALEKMGWTLPDRPNRASRQTDGSLLARLSQKEYLLLGSPSDSGHRVVDMARQHATGETGGYSLPRHDTHGWFALTGEHASAVMAKLCGVDLRQAAFSTGSVAQTSVAMINAIVINDTSSVLTCYQLLFDSATSHYFWNALLDAMQEFEGATCGFNTFHELRVQSHRSS